jgi:hypothetical protein
MPPTAEPPDTLSAVGLPRRGAQGTGSWVRPAAAVAARRTARSASHIPGIPGPMDGLAAWDLGADVRSPTAAFTVLALAIPETW